MGCLCPSDLILLEDSATCRHRDWNITKQEHSEKLVVLEEVLQEEIKELKLVREQENLYTGLLVGAAAGISVLLTLISFNHELIRTNINLVSFSDWHNCLQTLC